MRICFGYYHTLSSFIEKDYKLLCRTHDVLLLNFRREFYKSVLAVANCDLTFCWFADVHSAVLTAIGKSLGRKSILVSGGYDVANVPELRYGAFQYSLPTRASARYALRNADRIVVVAPSLKIEAMRNAGIDGSTVEYLPTGYDPEFWNPGGMERRQRIVLTVAHLNSRTIALKGVDIFIAAAALVPDADFVIVGMMMDDVAQHLARISPPNVRFAGSLLPNDLKTTYRGAAVYCQLSRHEGLPNALCEAMLCGCIPVGTSTGGIPLAMDNTGEIVQPGDVEAAAAAIQRALDAPETNRAKARQIIATRFTLSKREEGLLNLIEELEGQETDPGP